MQINGNSAVVTGGASGLGAATARLLVEHGAKVAIFDLNEQAGLALAAEIGAMFVKVDVSNATSVGEALRAASVSQGIARILVNCAGIGGAAKTVDRHGLPFPLESFRKVIEINLIGTFNVISQFAALLIAADKQGEERGVIVNTASVAAFDGQIGQAAYSASKGGIVGMTLPIARDLAAHAIRVVTIAPGIFLTPILAALAPAALESLGAQVPFPNRLGKPEEYAMLVESIVRNPMLNAETIRIDGAVRMAPR
ncbi:MAG: SDR family NAD(P)-dependent oxidoreductase [Pseudomonadota bacterium]|nr:SDR family NAD(P)-dependent oxidoreductase [Pseudomonadota bacterium]